jgi:hypothetical protein
LADISSEDVQYKQEKEALETSNPQVKELSEKQAYLPIINARVEEIGFFINSIEAISNPPLQRSNLRKFLNSYHGDLTSAADTRFTTRDKSVDIYQSVKDISISDVTAWSAELVRLCALWKAEYKQMDTEITKLQ